MKVSQGEEVKCTKSISLGVDSTALACFVPCYVDFTSERSCQLPDTCPLLSKVFFSIP